MYIISIGSRGAIRVDADRLVRDGVQAQPDALRAHLQPLAAPDGPAPERAHDCERPMVRAHARRQVRSPAFPPFLLPSLTAGPGQCEPAYHAPRGVPHRRHRAYDAAERLRGARRLPEGHRAPDRAGAAVHGHGEHHHGDGQGRRRPPGGAREDPGTLPLPSPCCCCPKEADRVWPDRSSRTRQRIR